MSAHPVSRRSLTARLRGVSARLHGLQGWRAVALACVVVLGAVTLDAGLLIHRVPTVPVTLPGSGGGQVFLLLASDSRERLPGADQAAYADRAQARGERADLVFLLRTGGSDAPQLLSVPRDLYVGQQRHRPHRLGLALQEGPQAIVDSLCQDLGVGVDHLVIGDFTGLIDAVDAAGGVTVRTSSPLRDPQAGLDLASAGNHQLDGRGALAWVRSRHPMVRRGATWMPEPAADLTRSTHATQVLGQLAAAARNPLTAQAIAWSAGPQLRRDRATSGVDLATLGWALHTAAASGRVATAPARMSPTEVPIAFQNEQTASSLTPFHSPVCRREG